MTLVWKELRGGNEVKVGLITIVDDYSYGNRLQCYASKCILEENGCQVVCFYTNRTIPYSVLSALTFLLTTFFCGLTQINNKFRKLLAFKSFDRANFTMSDALVKGKLNVDDFDYFVVGSDQVWNPTWYQGNKSEVFLLTFARNNRKVCMAPSFGISELPETWKPHFKKHLNTFPYLSVREAEGAKIIRELTGREAEIVIDPTLMLDAEDWRKIERTSPARDDGRNYILKLFLGRQSEENTNYINEIAQIYNYQILELMEPKQSDVFAAGPGEFIDLVDHAKLICTDSYHACIFSILFNKPFLVFERYAITTTMNSRIHTLLRTLDLERRLPGRVKAEDIFEHDYAHSYELLDKEREKARNFLRKSLNIDHTS